MTKTEELRETLKEFQRDFEKQKEEFNNIFYKFVDFSYKAKLYMNEMQKKLNKLETLERGKRKKNEKRQRV